MKKLSITLIIALFGLFGAGSAMAQEQTAPQPPKQHGPGFVDANGDGWNDNAPDADGDGIPNGADPDYQGPRKGAGPRFVDADGDGVNDLAQDADGDGIPNGKDSDYVRPAGQGKGFVDADGDGKNDNRKAWGRGGRGRFGAANPGTATGLQKDHPGKGNMQGPGDGTGMSPKGGQGRGKGKTN